jgi:L-amino acid N-acyltransferase YncA/2-polyprenyl-3-methyl-5-hydroxy-6-metoxy-1,4-benzoquinol methylase
VADDAGSARPADPDADEIRSRYAAAAIASTGCAPGACEPGSSAFGLPLYEADQVAGDVLSLGCGNPTAVADLRPGDTVLDLGSGAGLDLLLSARRVGPDGRVVGLDMTAEMVDLARGNAAAAGAGNVEVHLRCIEEIPLPGGSVDVVISNCVLNLAADKRRVLREVARVLRPGGRLGISDLLAESAAGAAELAESAATIGSGVRPVTEADYRRRLAEAGFTDVRIRPTHGAAPGIAAAIVQATKPTEPAVAVRPMRDDDWPAVAAVYADGIATGDATFETEMPAWQRWDSAHLSDHRLVAVAGDHVAGWAAVSRVSDRCAYAGVVEHSVYVAAHARGSGVGRALLAALIDATEQAGIWTLQAGVFPENEASLALHRAAGFRIIGTRQRLGRLHGQWRDVLAIERRSTVAGADVSSE